MQVVVACILLVSAALAAPYNGMYLRRPRSQGYGQYVAPCAAAGAIHTALPAYHPGPSYQLNLGPVQGYQQAHYGAYGGYGTQHYRAEDMEDNTGEEPETMSFSDTDPAASENMPMARYTSLGGYSGGNSIGTSLGGYSGGHGIGAGYSSGALGVFPGAHVNRCAVPLLLSCSPSIVPGHLVRSQYGSHYAPAYGAGALPIAGGEAYRGVDEQLQTVKEHASPAEHATAVHEAATSAAAAAAPDASRTQ